MSEQQSSRRKFLQFLGLSASTTLISTDTFSTLLNPTEIKKMNPEQQAFMMHYGKWMDEFIEVIRIQKTAPDNIENQSKMIALTEKAEGFQPELTKLMQDQTFALIYRLSTKRMTKEIS